MPEPLIVKAPYPAVTDAKNDIYSLKIISPAYATSTGELNAILQYVFHSMSFASYGKQDYAETLMGIAVAEMMHLNMLGNVIAAIGAQPVFTSYPPARFNFYSTKFVSYSSTLKNMIEDDIVGEKHAIYCYEKMLVRLKNSQIRCLIARILEDEQLHLCTLQSILKEISPCN